MDARVRLTSSMESLYGRPSSSLTVVPLVAQRSPLWTQVTDLQAIWFVRRGHVLVIALLTMVCVGEGWEDMEEN